MTAHVADSCEKCGLASSGSVEPSPEDDIIDRIDSTKRMQAVRASLTPREFRVLWLRLVEEKTLAELGELFAVSRERIRQIESKALRKLRHPSRTKALQVFMELWKPITTIRGVDRDKFRRWWSGRPKATRIRWLQDRRFLPASWEPSELKDEPPSLCLVCDGPCWDLDHHAFWLPPSWQAAPPGKGNAHGRIDSLRARYRENREAQGEDENGRYLFGFASDTDWHW